MLVLEPIVQERQELERALDRAREIVRYHVAPQRSGDSMHFDMQRIADLLLGQEAEIIRQGQLARDASSKKD